VNESAVAALRLHNDVIESLSAIDREVYLDIKPDLPRTHFNSGVNTYRPMQTVDIVVPYWYCDVVSAEVK